jgi:hypothetical protein
MADATHGLPPRLRRVEPAWHRRERQRRSHARLSCRLAADCLRLAHHHGSALPRMLVEMMKASQPADGAPWPSASPPVPASAAPASPPRGSVVDDCRSLYPDAQVFVPDVLVPTAGSMSQASSMASSALATSLQELQDLQTSNFERLRQALQERSQAAPLASPSLATTAPAVSSTSRKVPELLPDNPVSSWTGPSGLLGENQRGVDDTGSFERLVQALRDDPFQRRERSSAVSVVNPSVASTAPDALGREPQLAATAALVSSSPSLATTALGDDPFQAWFAAQVEARAASSSCMVDCPEPKRARVAGTDIPDA